MCFYNSIPIGPLFSRFTAHHECASEHHRISAQTRNSRLEKLTLFENILLVHHLIMQKLLLIFSCQNQPDGIKHEGIINLPATLFTACN
jgi:hypothetical protein